MEASLLRRIKINEESFLEYRHTDSTSGSVVIPFGEESSLYIRVRAEFVRAAFCQMNNGYEEEDLQMTLKNPEKSKLLGQHAERLEKSVRSNGTWVVFFEDKPVNK